MNFSLLTDGYHCFVLHPNTKNTRILCPCFYFLNRLADELQKCSSIQLTYCSRRTHWNAVKFTKHLSLPFTKTSFFYFFSLHTYSKHEEYAVHYQFMVYQSFFRGNKDIFSYPFFSPRLALSMLVYILEQKLQPTTHM